MFVRNLTDEFHFLSNFGEWDVFCLMLIIQLLAQKSLHEA